MMLGEIFGGGDVEPFLAAEIIGDRLQVDAGRVRKLARRSTVEAVATKDVESVFEQFLTRYVAARDLGFCVISLTHAAIIR